MCFFSLSDSPKRKRPHRAPVYVPVHPQPQPNRQRNHRESQPHKVADNSRGYISGYTPANAKERRRADERVMNWNDGLNGGQVQWKDPSQK